MSTTRATVRLVDPTAPEPAAAATSGGVGDLRGARVGVLENGKQHAELLLTGLAAALADGHGAVRADTHHKSVAAPAEPAVIDALVAGADLVLVGSAD